ncbi:MAG: YajQ family cyclic di-GMP-binding protein [Armatimonadota bacterium]
MAATEYSFDIVSRMDLMELKNGIDQAQKELGNRYDLKGSKCEIEFDGKEKVVVIADDEFMLSQVQDIIFSKLLKRGIDARQFAWKKPEPAAGLTIRCEMELKQGIAQDKAKPLIKQIRDKGLKVQPQIQGDEVRVTGKDKDDLQKTIAFVKNLDLDFPVDFVNFR